MTTPQRASRDRRIALCLAAVLVAVLGLWWIAEHRSDEAHDAKQSEAQAQAEAEASKDALEAQCAVGIRSACHQLTGLEDQPDPDDAEVQDSEIQEPEVQEPEQQDPEFQDPDRDDPEGQDPDRNDPERQDAEVQDPEVQDAEVDDPEQQDPEHDDPDPDDPDPNDPDPAAGTYNCPEGEWMRGFTIHEDGSVSMNCAPAPGPGNSGKK